MKYSIKIGILFILLTVISVSAYASWDEYYEYEENSPAYVDYGPWDQRYDSPANDVVYYYDARGYRHNVTRQYAEAMGYGCGGYYTYPDRCGSIYNSGYSGVGKRFYPNSNYKREVRAKEHKGVLTSVLDALI